MSISIHTPQRGETLIDFANKFHRVEGCGRIKKTSEDAND